MIRLTQLLILFGTISSCTSTIKQDQTETSSALRTLDTIVPFAGFWINERYINDIERTKSPLQSQGADVSCIDIPGRTLQRTRMIWGFHDGGADLTVVKTEKGFQFYYLENDSVAGPAYDIDVISESRIKIDDNYFVKSSALFLEEMLFTGQYTAEDGSAVEFASDGRIIGLDNFTTYTPIYDYSDAGMTVDQVILRTETRSEEYYGFLFSADTMRIYQLECTKFIPTDEVCEEMMFGKVIHVLIRK